MKIWHSESTGDAEFEDGSTRPIYEIRNDGGDLIADAIDECDVAILTSAPQLIDALKAAEGGGA